ncbi:MAG: VOC family protein [Sneathiella sp.]|nr:VOC family protein [Sneathiella sp.]
MNRKIAALSVLVPDYDQAISYYVDILGFKLISDTPLSESKRWVLVSPGDEGGCHMLLAKADTEQQRLAVGQQTGDRVFAFLHTDDFDRDYNSFKEKDVTFLEEPRDEVYGKVAVFRDMFGNKWDLIEPKK